MLRPALTIFQSQGVVNSVWLSAATDYFCSSRHWSLLNLLFQTLLQEITCTILPLLCLVVYNQILHYVKLPRILYFGSRVSIKKFESFIFQDCWQFFIVVYEIAVCCVETAWTGVQFRLQFSANINCIRLVLLFSFHLCFCMIYCFWKINAVSEWFEAICTVIAY
jgi:hypothetical protein